MSEKLIEVKELKTQFNGKNGTVTAVDGVSFSVERGKTLGIVGESGCGKSVTSMSILRLIPAVSGKVAGGEVFFEGEDLLKKTEKEMRQIRGNEIAMIFQDSMTGLNPVMTIGKQLVETITAHSKVDKKAAWKRAEEMLAKVGIPSPAQRLKEFPHQLSGGMRQRVMIAMALSCNAKLLIADEPTTALDVTIQAQIMELLKDLQVNDGKSIILITHNMGLVAEMADEVCVMYMGRVVEFGTLEDVFDRTSHPYTRALLRSVPVLGLADGQKLETIPGATPNPADLKEGCEFADRCPECTEKCRKGVIPCYEVNPGHHVRCTKYSSFPEVE